MLDCSVCNDVVSGGKNQFRFEIVGADKSDHYLFQANSQGEKNEVIFFFFCFGKMHKIK